jgi:hypothetical protein
MTLLVTVSAMRIELVVAVESLSAEAALGMPLETSLVYRARMVVTKSFVLLKVCRREQLMFVCECLLVPRTQITHDFVMRASHMPMQVWPTQTCHCALIIRTIIPQQENRVLTNLRLLILDSQFDVLHSQLLLFEILIPLLRLVGEDDKFRARPTMQTCLRLEQRPHS